MAQPRGYPAWSINGRFYSQNITGVQRYAAEIVSALDNNPELDQGEAALFLADNCRFVPNLQRIDARGVPGPGGHVWEQVHLPRANAGPLLNLCNRGPISARRQVICIHDMNVFLCPESYSTAFRLAYKTMLPIFARRAQVVTTVSKFSAAEISRRFGIPIGAITVLPNGHEHALRWQEANSDIFQRQSLERPFLLTIGSRAKHKNLELLFRLSGALDDLGVDLAVAGGGGHVFSGAGNRQPRGVRLLGYVSNDDLAALLKRALCLVFPSLTEGFGLPLVEAMALGCPVISSSRASMPEVCGAAALYADPSEPEAWLSQIRRLKDSSGLQEELRRKGILQARKFSWHKSAEGYLRLMRALV